MTKINIESINGRFLFFDNVKSYGLKCTEGGHVGMFEIKKEDGTAVFMNWDQVLFASCKEDKDDGEIH